MPRTPRTSRAMRLISGGVGAPPPVEHAQPREQRRRRRGALGVEVGEEERHRAAEHGRAVRGHALGRRRGVERLEQHEPHAGHQRRGEHEHPADVGDRDGDGVDVVGRCAPAADRPGRRRASPTGRCGGRPWGRRSCPTTCRSSASATSSCGGGGAERRRIALREAERVADRRRIGVEVGDDHGEALLGGEIARQRRRGRTRATARW